MQYYFATSQNVIHIISFVGTDFIKPPFQTHDNVDRIKNLFVHYNSINCFPTQVEEHLFKTLENHTFLSQSHRHRSATQILPTDFLGSLNIIIIIIFKSFILYIECILIKNFSISIHTIQSTTDIHLFVIIILYLPILNVQLEEITEKVLPIYTQYSTWWFVVFRPFSSVIDFEQSSTTVNK